MLVTASSCINGQYYAPKTCKLALNIVATAQCWYESAHHAIVMTKEKLSSYCTSYPNTVLGHLRILTNHAVKQVRPYDPYIHLHISNRN